MLNLFTKEVISGTMVSLNYMTWMVFIAFCFIAEPGRKNKCRFDRIKVKLPEKNFKPDEPQL